MLGFKVTESSADGKSTWEDSERSDERVVHSVLISWRLLHSNLLKTWLALVVDN